MDGGEGSVAHNGGAVGGQRGDAAAALRSLEAALAINPRMPRGAERLREMRRKAEGDAL